MSISKLLAKLFLPKHIPAATHYWNDSKRIILLGEIKDNYVSVTWDDSHPILKLSKHNHYLEIAYGSDGSAKLVHVTQAEYKFTGLKKEDLS